MVIPMAPPTSATTSAPRVGRRRRPGSACPAWQGGPGPRPPHTVEGTDRALEAEHGHAEHEDLLDSGTGKGSERDDEQPGSWLGSGWTIPSRPSAPDLADARTECGMGDRVSVVRRCRRAGQLGSLRRHARVTIWPDRYEPMRWHPREGGGTRRPAVCQAPASTAWQPSAATTRSFKSQSVRAR